MNFSNALYQSACAFIAGLAASAYRKFDRGIEQLDVYEAIPQNTLEEITDKKIAPETIKKIRRCVRNFNLFLPTAIGCTTPIIYEIATHEKNPENLLFTLPSAFAGYFAGKGIYRLKRRKFRREIEALREISANPDSIEKYLTGEQKEVVVKSLEGIEDEVFAGTFTPEKSVNLRGMYESITTDQKLYTPLLIKWSFAKFGKIAEKALLARNLSQFYEPELPKDGNWHMIACNTSGDFLPTRSSVVFRRGGGNLYVEEVKIDRTQIVEDDRSKGVMVGTSGVNVTEISEYPWNPGKNYGNLADIVEQNSKDKNRILMNTPEDCPGGARRIILQSTIMEKIAESTLKDKEERK